jgi:hypothetical protein
MEIAMKRYVMTVTAALALLLLGGCASTNTIRSEVTTFHQWPAQLQDKSYVFEAAPAQDDTLELRSYQNLVRGELATLGFRELAAGTPALKVSMRFSTTEAPLRLIQPVDPFFYGPRFAWGRPYHRGRYSPFYDPFWGGGPMYEEAIVRAYRREVQVAIKSAQDGHRLFDVTVRNLSGEMSTPAVMPALVHSAFVGFPGPSGVARRIDVTLPDEPPAAGAGDKPGR